MISFDTPGRSLKTWAEITGEIPRPRPRPDGFVDNTGKPAYAYRVDEKRSGLWFHWTVDDRAENPYRHVATGRALTYRRAARALEKAVAFDRDQLAAAREIAQAEADARAADEKGCE